MHAFFLGARRPARWLGTRFGMHGRVWCDFLVERKR